MCDKCEPFGGLWMETPNGLCRCTCPAGDKFRSAPTPKPPRLSVKDTEVFVEMLMAIPYFRTEAGAVIQVGNEIRAMCKDAEEALWLVQRMNRLYSRWPGTQEMRRVYCGRHVPLDGVPPKGISEVYPDGITSEDPIREKQIEGPPPMRKLPEGREVSAGKRTDTAVRIAFATHAVANAPMDRPATPEEIASAPDWLRRLEGYDG